MLWAHEVEATGLSQDMEGITISPPFKFVEVDIVNDKRRCYHVY